MQRRVSSYWAARLLRVTGLAQYRWCSGATVDDAAPSQPRRRRVAIRVRASQEEEQNAAPPTRGFEVLDQPRDVLDQGVAYSDVPSSPPPAPPPPPPAGLRRTITALSEVSDDELAKLWDGLPATADADVKPDVDITISDYWNERLIAQHQEVGMVGVPDRPSRPRYKLPMTLLRIASGKETEESAFAPRTVPRVEQGHAWPPRAPRRGRVPAPLTKGRAVRFEDPDDPGFDMELVNKQSSSAVWNARRESAPRTPSRESARIGSVHQNASSTSTRFERPHAVVTPRMASSAHKRRVPDSSPQVSVSRREQLRQEMEEGGALEDSEAEFLRHVANARNANRISE